MKTNIIALLVIVLGFTKANAQCAAVYIPNTTFKTYLLTNTDINLDGNGEISCDEASNFTGSIDVDDLGITNLTGIEAFENLRTLKCDRNSLTNLDVSKNTALVSLFCDYNSLTNLDVSENTTLESLFCNHNSLVNLDLTKNTKLKYVACYSNSLVSLDISQNTMLSTLLCYRNDLPSLDVSANNMLTNLDCEANLLTSLDVSLNTALTSLICDRNSLTDIDISKNTALNTLNCSTNLLTSLDVSKNTSLSSLLCNSNTLTNLDISNNTGLLELLCASNALTDLDLAKNTKLTRLTSDNNVLTSLDLSKNIMLRSIRCANNNLYSLKITNGNSLNLDINSSNFKNNDNLSCIQVDDLVYANTNWTSLKDDTANYSENCEIDCVVNIPNTIFKNKLVNNSAINTNSDTEISCAEAALYTGTMNLEDSAINDLTGIEAFVNMTALDCSGNELTNLNIANGGNTKLTYFNAVANPNLTCIQVDNVAYSTANFTNIDATASFSLNCSATASVVDATFSDKITVYPNPVTHKLIVNLESETELKNIKIYNLIGKEILSSTNTNLDLNTLKPGVYILKIYSRNGEITMKKIVKG